MERREELIQPLKPGCHRDRGKDVEMSPSGVVEQRRAIVRSCITVYYQATTVGKPENLQKFSEETLGLILDLPFAGLEKDAERVGKLLAFRSMAFCDNGKEKYEDHFSDVMSFECFVPLLDGKPLINAAGISEAECNANLSMLRLSDDEFQRVVLKTAEIQVPCEATACESGPARS